MTGVLTLLLDDGFDVDLELGALDSDFTRFTTGRALGLRGATSSSSDDSSSDPFALRLPLAYCVSVHDVMVSCLTLYLL